MFEEIAEKLGIKIIEIGTKYTYDEVLKRYQTFKREEKRKKR